MNKSNALGKKPVTGAKKEADVMSKRNTRMFPEVKLGPGGQTVTGSTQALNKIQEEIEQKHFSRLDNMQRLTDSLRDSYIRYKEYARLCKIKLSEGGGNDQTHKFYYKPKIPFMKKPEKQRVYRKEYIEDVGKLPEPEPLYLLSDGLHLAAIETIGDRKSPEVTKNTLTQFFHRRFTQLQHKKHRLLHRWANTQIDSKSIDANATEFQRALANLQLETDSVIRRVERLQLDDKFSEAKDYVRPVPTISEAQHQMAQKAHQESLKRAFNEVPDAALQQKIQSQEKGGNERARLYVASDEHNSINSAIRLEDIEVFLRVQTYQNKIKRLGDKLTSQIKWLPISARYDIWSEARKLIFQEKVSAEERKATVMREVGQRIKSILEELPNPVTDEKSVLWAQERYTYHIKGGPERKRPQKMKECSKFDVESPPMVYASDIELRMWLEPEATKNKLSVSQIDMDKGSQLLYQLSTFFPQKFEEQVAAMQFDWEDSGYDADIAYLDRLTKSLGLSKHQLLGELKTYGDKQRKQGIMNALKNERNAQQKEDNEQKSKVEALTEEEFSRQSMIRRLRTIEFFTLDENSQKLRKADWLEYVVFDPYICDSVVRQNQLLSIDENEIDHLLLGAFNFIDIHDSATVNKIIEQSAGDHVKKVLDVQKAIDKGYYSAPKTGRHYQNEAAQPEDQTNSKSTSNVLRGSVFPQEFNKKPTFQEMGEEQQAKLQRLKEIPNVNPLNQNTLKVYYTLRLVKTRDVKIKLLGVMNYFRAVQRLLTLDLKEFYSRERSLPETSELDQIQPYYGKNPQTGGEFAKTSGLSTPGNIFQTHVDRNLDTTDHYNYDEAEEEARKRDIREAIRKGEPIAKTPAEEEAEMKDPITLKAYKFRDKFAPLVTSTCPLVPKHHRTFGRQSLFEMVSEEIDRNTETTKDPQATFRCQSKHLIEKKDRIFVNDQLKEIKVLNEFGIPIIYEEALQDMVALEEEMIKIGSYYINQYEHRQVSSGNFTMKSIFSRPSYMVDRPQLVQDMFDKEMEFQYTKVSLIEVLLETYEHTTDPLESVRILQMIVDVMAHRPRLNMDASMYTESYDSETALLRNKRQFYKEFIRMQKKVEEAENRGIDQFQGMKCRKMQEFMSGDMVFDESSFEEKVEREGSQEESGDKDQAAVKMQQKMQSSAAAERDKKEALERIAARHITEFANEQYTDFSQILGLPNITIDELNQKQPKRDPIIIDAIREAAFFEKATEGYPVVFSKTRMPGKTAGLHTRDIGLTDFYDSLQSISKVSAALAQGFSELKSVTVPENGFCESCLEQKFLDAARLKLKKVQIHEDEETNVPEMLPSGAEADSIKMRGARDIENDFYFANSDKLVYAMRSFQAEMHPETILKRANPMVVASLDIQSVQNFNFPRLKQAEVVASLEEQNMDQSGLPRYTPRGLFEWDNPAKFATLNDQQKDEGILHRMIDLAKNSISRQFLQMSRGMADRIDEAFEEENDKSNKVRIPSMLIMACNISEVIRLREELIRSVHETSILANVYKEQAKLANRNATLKSGDQTLPATMLSEAIDIVNVVDNNDGSKIFYDLAFTEFDKSLGRNLDFKSESCVKSLMTDLGVEELRAIVHYQVMQQQLLHVAVTVNTLLLDGTQRACAELDLIYKPKYPVAVPSTVLNLDFVSESGEGFNPSKAKGIKNDIIIEMRKKLSNCLYWILPRKQDYTKNLAKQYNSFVSRMHEEQRLSKGGSQKKLQSETKLRVLRSMRIRMLHQFCKRVLKEVYTDALKIQSLDACNQLRLRANMFPTDCRVFKLNLGISMDEQVNLGAGALQENLSYDAINRQFEQAMREKSPDEKIEDLVQCQFKDKSGMVYIPSSVEVMSFDRAQKTARLNKEKDIQDRISMEIYELEDLTQKLVQMPTRCAPFYQSESKQNFSQRKVDFVEAYPYNYDAYNLLSYFTSTLKIFNLEYLMGRNAIPSSQLLPMETKVLAGVPFWTQVEKNSHKLEIEFALPQDAASDSGDNSSNNSYHPDEREARRLREMSVSERVIRRVIKKKKGWINLAYDMTQIADRIKNIHKLVSHIPRDLVEFPYVLDVLQMQHHSSFFQFLNGIETMIQHYCEKGLDDYFQKAQEVRQAAMKMQRGIHIFVSNGYYVTQAAISPMNMRLNTNGTPEQDYEDLRQSQLAVIDEAGAVPTSVNAVQRMYGEYSRLDRLSSDCFLSGHMRNYQNLMNSFLGLEDPAREHIGANLLHIDDEVEDYLIYKGLLELPQQADSERLDETAEKVNAGIIGLSSINLGNKKSVLSRLGKSYEVDLLAAKVEFLSFKIEAKHQQRVFMSWVNGGVTLPADTESYMKLLKQLEDTTMFRVLVERDILNEIYWTQQENKQRRGVEQKDKGKSEPAGAIEGLSAHDKKLILDRVNTRSPEYQFFNKVNMIRAESILLKHLLEVELIKIGTQMITQEHSAIQAAFDQCGTEGSVQAYVHPNQQFASTLFQDVDSLAHLNVLTKLGFAHSFMTRLRNRCTEVETLTSKAIVFTMKDFNECLQIFCKQILKYGETELRSRCETFAVRENQYRHIIYLKEMQSIYYQHKCEQFLKNVDSIISAKMSQRGNRMIYEHDLTTRELRTLKDNYFEMEDTMREEVRLEFQRKISTGEGNLRRTQKNFKEYKQELGTSWNKEMGDWIETVVQGASNAQHKSWRPPAHMVDVPPFKHKDPDGQQEILGLFQYIRKFKTYQVMKEVTTQERHDREIAHMQEKLTQNQVLWDQLAESEKREQITRQELELTKQSLVQYEKLIEKLYGQLEHLNNQKMRLLQYKNSKSKRIGELEAKMKEIEILESIDLNTILEEMRLRDRKLVTLTAQQKNQGAREKNLYKVFDHEMDDIRAKYDKEHAAKMDAFEKLEAMRLEIKTLEGKDMKNDLWKDKCRELYDMCSELEQENVGIKDQFIMTQQRLEQACKENEILQIQLEQSRTANSSAQKGTSLREQTILQRVTAAKPMTASQGRMRTSGGQGYGKLMTGKAGDAMTGSLDVGKGGRMPMGGVLGPRNAMRASNNLANDWTSITTNVSFPGLHKNDANGMSQGQQLSGRGPIQVTGGGFRNQMLTTSTAGGGTTAPHSVANKRGMSLRQRQTEKNLQLAGNNVGRLNTAKRIHGSLEQVNGQGKSGTQLSEQLANEYQGSEVLAGNILMTGVNQPILSSDGAHITHAFQVNPKRHQTSQGHRAKGGQQQINSSHFDSDQFGGQLSSGSNIKGIGLGNQVPQTSYNVIHAQQINPGRGVPLGSTAILKLQPGDPSSGTDPNKTM